jgi:hypothetical protein
MDVYLVISIRSGARVVLDPHGDCKVGTPTADLNVRR